jgi:hypothetical protein
MSRSAAVATGWHSPSSMGGKLTGNGDNDVPIAALILEAERHGSIFLELRNLF